MAKLLRIAGLGLGLLLGGLAQAEVLSQTVVERVVQGQRASVQVALAGADQLKIVRLYFKRAADAQYNFVVLKPLGGGLFTAELPAVGENISAIDYRIVTQSADGVVYKSPKYSIPVVAGIAGATALNAGFVDVYSEAPEALTNKDGFKDNVRYTYNASQVAQGAAAGAAVAGAGAAEGAFTALGWGAVGVGVAGGAAVASSSGGSSKSSSRSTASGGSTTTETNTAGSSSGPASPDGSDDFDLADIIGVPNYSNCNSNYVVITRDTYGSEPEYKYVYQVRNGAVVQWGLVDAYTGQCRPINVKVTDDIGGVTPVSGGNESGSETAGSGSNTSDNSGGIALPGGRSRSASFSSRTSSNIEIDFPNCSGGGEKICMEDLADDPDYEVISTFPCGSEATLQFYCDE